MTRTSAHALAVARPVIQGLIVLNVLYALGHRRAAGLQLLHRGLAGSGRSASTW